MLVSTICLACICASSARNVAISLHTVSIAVRFSFAVARNIFQTAHLPPLAVSLDFPFLTPIPSNFPNHYKLYYEGLTQMPVWRGA